MMGSLWLDGAAFLALEYNLSLLQPHSLDHLFSGVSSRHSTLQIENTRCHILVQNIMNKTVSYRVC